MWFFRLLFYSYNSSGCINLLKIANKLIVIKKNILFNLLGLEKKYTFAK